MSKPDTLVVTATLGERESLNRTIKSVSEVGGERVKHLIITPSNKRDLLQEKYNHVEVITEPQNCNGIYPALNYAFQKFGRGFKYFSFINDDDYWLSDYRKLFKIIEKDEDIDVVYGKVIYVNGNGTKIGLQSSSPRYEAFGALLLKDIIMITQQATLMRSNLFWDLQGFKEDFRLISDTDFWLRAINKNFTFKYINKYCAAYTIDDGRLSSDKALQKKEHKILKKKIESPSAIRVKLERLYYRLYNINLYLQRFLKRGSFKRYVF